VKLKMGMNAPHVTSLHTTLRRHTTLSSEEDELWEEVFLLLMRMGAQINQVQRVVPLSLSSPCHARALLCC
jgi:hypothetical protein